MCKQQKLRSSCAYWQSGQSLCYSLDYSISIKLLTEHHLEFLSLKGGCTDSSQSTLDKIPHCWNLMSRLKLFTGMLSINSNKKRNMPIHLDLLCVIQHTSFNFTINSTVPSLSRESKKRLTISSTLFKSLSES